MCKAYLILACRSCPLFSARVTFYLSALITLIKLIVQVVQYKIILLFVFDIKTAELLMLVKLNTTTAIWKTDSKLDRLKTVLVKISLCCKQQDSTAFYLPI